MNVLDRRVKMVSFRLSDEEYRQALQTCLDQGFRSISALARAATVRALGGDGTEEDEQHMTSVSPGTAYSVVYPDLDARLNELALVLARVTALLSLNFPANLGPAADGHHSGTAIAATSSH